VALRHQPIVRSPVWTLSLVHELISCTRPTQHRQAEGSVVVYVVDPGPLIAPTSKPTAPQELLRCAVPILRATKDLPHLNIAFQILPSALLLEPWYRPRSIKTLWRVCVSCGLTFCGYARRTGASLRDLAFSVFSKCRRMSSPHSVKLPFRSSLFVRMR
jgi:hypothetical protein